MVRKLVITWVLNKLPGLTDRFSRSLSIFDESEIFVRLLVLIFEFGQKFQARDLTDRTRKVLHGADQIEYHDQFRVRFGCVIGSLRPSSGHGITEGCELRS